MNPLPLKPYNADNLKILAIAQAEGSCHDFRLFENNYRGVDSQIKLLGDSGFKGILKLYANSITPKKSSKHHPLTLEEKQANIELSSKRIVIEHANRWIKRFKILQYRYRNHRKRHGLRVSLHNFEMLI